MAEDIRKDPDFQVTIKPEGEGQGKNEGPTRLLDEEEWDEVAEPGQPQPRPRQRHVEVRESAHYPTQLELDVEELKRELAEERAKKGGWRKNVGSAALSITIGMLTLVGLNLDSVVTTSLWGYNLSAVIGAIVITVLVFFVFSLWIRLSEKESNDESLS